MSRSPLIDIPVILIAGFLFVSSCTYNPSGTNFQEKEATVVPVNVVLSLDPALEADDILKIADRVEYSYRVFPNGRSNLRISLQLGQRQLENKDLSYTELTRKHNSAFFSQQFDDGMYDLKMVVTANSGSGSLADLTRNETVQFTYTWKVEIDNAPATAPQINEIEANNGVVRINWNPYDRPRFNYYQVKRVNETGNSEFYRFPENVIFNRYTTTATDPGFIGGKATYAVIVSDMYTMGTGDFYSLEESYPVFTEYEINGSDLTLSWSECLFPGNFGKYVLQETYNSGGIRKSWEFENVTHTSHTITDFSENHGFIYRLITIPKVPYQSWQNQTVDTLTPT